MPDGPVSFPCSKTDSGDLTPMPVGRQSAILAKTLFINRFQSLPPIEQTRGIRVGGCGFQMIKEGFRESVGFGVFSVTATPPCATHNLAALAGAGRPGAGPYPQPRRLPAFGSTCLARKGRTAKIPAEATKGDSKF